MKLLRCVMNTLRYRDAPVGGAVAVLDSKCGSCTTDFLLEAKQLLCLGLLLFC